MEEARLLWIEEPVTPTDLPGYRLAARQIKTAIAGGEAIMKTVETRPGVWHLVRVTPSEDNRKARSPRTRAHHSDLAHGCALLSARFDPMRFSVPPTRRRIFS